MKKINYYVSGIIFLLLLSTCKGGSADKKQTAEISEETASDISNIKQALGDIYYLFPSPGEILTVINQGSLVFKPELLNSINKREKYVKSNEQYLNLGVYIADLSYCALFARNNDAENYIGAIKRMSAEMNLSVEINKELIERMNDKANSVDSLVKITDELFFKVVSSLEENNRQNDVAVITTGAYIECLYLSANLVKKYSKDNLVIQNIAEQKHAFSNLYEYSKKYIPNEDLMKSFSYIKRINDTFRQFSERVEMVEVKEEGNKHLLISGGSTTVVTESEFNAFKENITEIRKSITK